MTNPVVKMSIIVTIQMLIEKINGNYTPFESLDAMSYADLEVYRDELIVEYNDVMEARKFGAEMIYGKRGE
ncbi:MAG: hypothetical protein P9L97_05820 [Candidatus Tenebribacter davisii]|nr:hypothetical protein [Candidatus Tenebribacter davisii]